MTQPTGDAYPAHVGASEPQQTAYPVHPDPNATPYSIGGAFSWALSKFSANAVGLVGGAAVHTLLLALGPAIAAGGAFLFADSFSIESGGGGTYEEFTDWSLTPGSYVAIAFGLLVTLLLTAYSLSAYIGGVVDIANGQLTTFGSFFRPRNYAKVLGTVVLLSLALALGSLVFLVGAVVVVFLFWFAIPIVVDRGVGPWTALKQSASLVRANFGESLVTALLVGMVWVVGNSACGVFVIVTAPIATLIAVFALRRFAGDTIAP
ncbi:MAG: hypothetical protein QM728_03150 [Gordonia sp. (in: high G+C Gram-positive bacteria)]|uniref:hypothetical protein n=1 Tax=Gordonia sp. (in: high G+C Gram-positive bacteria) TaxID=84139 RepID=UPI0039E65CC0